MYTNTFKIPPFSVVFKLKLNEKDQLEYLYNIIMDGGEDDLWRRTKRAAYLSTHPNMSKLKRFVDYLIWGNFKSVNKTRNIDSLEIIPLKKKIKFRVIKEFEVNLE